MSIKTIFLALFLLFFTIASALADQPVHRIFYYKKRLSLLPGQSMACEFALAGVHLNAVFTVPNLNYGLGHARIENATFSNPPIDSDLYQDGDSDRHGFTHYYLPAIPIKYKHHMLLIRGIILNVCEDHKAEAGVMVQLKGDNAANKTCLMTTRVWNYCR
jgi:hypothetical protein